MRLADFPAGPEDFIFSFACGGTAWLLAVWPYRRRVTVSLSPGRFLGRYLVWTAAGVSLSAVCWYSGFGPIEAAMAGIMVVGAALLARRLDLWPLPVAGGAGFSLFYAFFITAAVLAWPDLGAHWNAENLWGPRASGRYGP